MVMKAMRQGAAGGIFKFVIFGFLMMAVGGMVLMDVGGFFRSGGVGGTNVAKVGKESISLQSFDRNLRRSLTQLGIQPQEAYKAGYIDQMLTSEIRSRLLEQSSRDLGVLIDTKRVASQIKTLIGPMVQPGQDPRDVLKQILMSQNMSEADLSRAIGQEITLGVLQSTLRGGFAAIPDALAEGLYTFEAETRNIIFVPFLESGVKSVSASDEQLQGLYEKTKDMVYASDERRVLQLVKLNSDALKKTVEIDEQEIRDAYDDSIDLYTEKEQRLLDQALFDSEDKAKQVAEKAKAGASLQQAVKEVTRRDSDYIGEKSFEAASLPIEIREIVTSVEKAGETVGPLKTSIGWQVIVVKKIIPSKVRPYEQVKKEIREELLETKTIDHQYEMAGVVEDLLAGGATLDDVKKEADVTITSLPLINAYGQGKDGKDALKNYEKSRSIILENGFSLGQGETSPMSENSDGEFIAVHVGSIEPKTYTPFEKVKDDMQKRWVNDQRMADNRMQVMVMLDEIKKSGATAEDFAKSKGKTLQTQNKISRKSAPPKPLNERSWLNLFEAEPGQPFILDIDGGTSIAWVTSAEIPDKVATDSKEFKDFKAGLLASTQNEAVMIYGENKRKKYGASINKRLLDQAYGQVNDSY